MGDSKTAPMDGRDIPEFSQPGDSRLKHTESARGLDEIACFTSTREMATCASAMMRAIDMTIADIRDLETTVAAVLEKANPIIRRQVADLKVRA